MRTALNDYSELAQTQATATWLARVIKTDVTGTVLAVTQYAYDGDGVRVRKADPSGTTLYIGLTEVTLAYTPPAGMGNTGVSADGLDLRKRSAPVAWSAGVFDGQHAITQTGFAQVRAETKYSGYRLFGLTTSDIGGGFCPTRYGLELVHGGTLEIYENCVRVAYPPALVYGAGDQLRIEADAGVVRYKRQVAGSGTWEVLYTSTLPVTAALYFNASLYTPGSTLKEIRFVSGSTAAPSVNRTYYTFGGARVAMRDGVGAALVYLHGDHLGSASLATSMTGTVLSQQRYKPYGEVRWASGAGMPTDFTFTGQRAGPPSYVGSLTDYVARFYSPALGRFISADTIVPTLGSSIALNRYAYVFDSPLVYQDPSGHCAGPSAILCIAVMALLVSACTNETPRLTPSPSGAPDKFDGKFPVLAERSHEMTDGSPYQPIATVPPGSDGAGGGNPGVGIPPGSGMNGYGQTHKVDPSNGGLSMALGVILGATGGYFPYSRGSQAYGSYRDSIQQTAKSAGYEAQEHKFDVTTFDRFLAGASRPALMLLPVTYLNGASNGIYGAGEREVFAILRGLSSDKKFVIFDNPVDGLGKIELPAEFFLDKLYWTFSEQK